jgi:cytochrome c-type biogenesis protein CcmF
MLRARGGFAPVSRESFLLFNNVLLLAATGMILLGTLYPLFIDALNLGKISVGPPYFNVVFLIPTLPLLALLGVGMHATWKKARLDELKKSLLAMLAASIVLAVLVPVLAYGRLHPLASVGLTAGFFVLLSACYEPVQRLRHGHTLSRGVLGMSVAHVGVGLFCIGVTIVSSFNVERDLSLRPGTSAEVRGYTFHFDSTQSVTGPNFDATQANFRITRDGREVTRLSPQKRTYRVQTSPMTEAGIEPAWNRDLFVAMGEDIGDNAWSFRLQYKPMVRFIWLGALVMALGGLIAITDRRYRTRRVEADERVLSGRSVKAT